MTIDELHDYCRFLLEHHYTHDRPGAWSRGYTFALGHIMHKCHAGLSDEDRQRIEAVAKRLCWNSCKWDGVDSYAAKDEDDAWNYAGEIPGLHEEYIRQAKEMLEIARKAVTE